MLLVVTDFKDWIFPLPFPLCDFSGWIDDWMFLAICSILMSTDSAFTDCLMLCVMEGISLACGSVN